MESHRVFGLHWHQLRDRFHHQQALVGYSQSVDAPSLLLVLRHTDKALVPNAHDDYSPMDCLCGAL